jgi:hypothetical protein
MKVYVFPADVTGCGYYRLIWPAEALQAQGHNVVVVDPKQRNAMLKGAVNANNELVDVRVPSDADVVVLQRITHRHLVNAVKIMRAKGVAVVIDIDDDLAAIHPANPAFLAMHPKNGVHPDHNWKNTQLACENATYVIVSTDALLKRYAPHGRGVVLRNCVPERYLEIDHVDSPVIGWGGSVHSHPDDLQTVGPAIDQLMSETQFRVVGPGDQVRNVLRLSRDPEVTGVCAIADEWPRTLAQLGIGIAPLADTRFNAGKSHLKPLEYSALGVPWVASPRAEYKRLHEQGIGLLADKPRQWVSQLRKLVRDPVLRTEMSVAGREAAAKMTIESNAWRWLEVWQAARDYEN